ncbi:Cytosolic seryl-tRNA synthetase [Conglomerata obtusa]
MIDIDLIRKQPELVKESEKKRFRSTELVDKVLALDEEWRKEKYNLDQLKKRMNLIQNEIKANFKKIKCNAKETAIEDKEGLESMSTDLINALNEKMIEERNDLKVLQDELSKKVNTLVEEIKSNVTKIGNIVKPGVVVSNDEKDNLLVRDYRSKRKVCNKFSYPELFYKIKGIDQERGARISGHRGYYLFEETAILGMSLSRYAIDFMRNKGYVLVQTPVFMNKETMSKTAQLSDFDDQLYHLEGDNYLIATSEQPLTALHMDENIFELPIKYVGHSLCFRKEAGAHGKDNQGIFRVHQFEKIEQFVICNENESEKYFDEMINVVEEFYKSLDISFNVVSIVSGELNDAAAIKYDLECLFPHTNKFRELVSCSNCTDYQSRDLEVRNGYGKENDRKVYVHMLNCTVVAVQRMLCCILENYQADDCVLIPGVLIPYFGKDRIFYKK